MIQFNHDILNEYLAPNITKFNEFNVEKISDFKEANYWIQNYFLNTLHGRKYKKEFKHLVMQCIRRTTHSCQLFNETVDLSLDFIKTSNPDNPRSKLYYNIINNWETTLLNIQMFTDSYNKMQKINSLDKAFKSSDGSPEQRAYDMANSIKHCGIKNDDVAIKYGWVPLWIDNKGLVSNDVQLSYIELRQIIIDLAIWTDEYSNPNK